jgi:hypothetical protein
MTVLKRDTHYHTYADYLTWSGSYGDELIDGTAYVREAPAPSYSHQGTLRTRDPSRTQRTNTDQRRSRRHH